MRTRINNITFTPGTRSINTGITDLTVDDVRLFINESQMKVICSSMLKSNIDSIVSGVVTYKNTFPVLASGDHITFEVDLGDNVAKQGSNPDVSLTSIDEKIDDFYDTFDADMALQLQGIIGEGDSVEGNSQTEGEIERLRTLQESYDALSRSEIGTELSVGKQQLAAAITGKGVTTASTDPLSTMAGNVQAIQNVTKEFEEVDFIEKWQGQSMINGLNIIHQYYNVSLPTSQCYVVVDGAILSIPVGASRLIYYNNGTLTTIDNPSGDYMIGAVPNNVIGFALLQYAGRTINNLAIAATDKVYSISAYDADITFQSLASTSVSMIQLEDCEVSFVANVFQNSALSTFILYGTSTIKNGIISNPLLFGSCTDLEYISLPNLATISGASFFYNCTNLEHIHLPNLLEILAAGTFSGLNRLYAIDLPNLQILNSSSTFQNDYNLRVINLPNLKTFSAIQCFYACQSLVKLNMHNLESFNGSSAFTNCINLIHLDIGAGMNVSFNINSWSPTNALSSSSSSLVDPDETFANNLEKLLYNIREHIAANLPDRTGLSSLTLTMSAAVKAAINGDTATANAFANKNWIIA